MRNYQSNLAPYIKNFVAQKQSNGFIYESEALTLMSFDKLCLKKNIEARTLPRNLIMEWAKQRPCEGKNSRNSRVSCVRQLALYMLSLGLEVYVPHHNPSNSVSVPYILNYQELNSLYNVIDSYVSPEIHLYRFSLVYPVIFRLFYCCGLRLAEGCHLKRTSVDLDKGYIKVYESKGHKDRIVQMSFDVCLLCRNYDNKMQLIIPDREWFFPGLNPTKHIHKCTVDSKFDYFWKQTQFASTVDKKPTIHCLRHTFVINKMNQWMDEERPLQVMLPYLSRYLGHISIANTWYYYHVVSGAFDIVRKHNLALIDIIPEVIPYEN
jgi:site-specific recombinase XerD